MVGHGVVLCADTDRNYNHSETTESLHQKEVRCRPRKTLPHLRKFLRKKRSVPAVRRRMKRAHRVDVTIMHWTAGTWKNYLIEFLMDTDNLISVDAIISSHGLTQFFCLRIWSIPDWTMPSGNTSRWPCTCQKKFDSILKSTVCVFPDTIIPPRRSGTENLWGNTWSWRSCYCEEILLRILIGATVSCHISAPPFQNASAYPQGMQRTWRRWAFHASWRTAYRPSQATRI